MDEDPDHECPDSEHFWEDSDYKMCREHAENDFLLNAKQQGMCGLLNKVSDDCLREFENCFAPNVFQDVKDYSLTWEVEKLSKVSGLCNFFFCLSLDSGSYYLFLKVLWLSNKFTR